MRFVVIVGMLLLSSCQESGEKCIAEHNLEMSLEYGILGKGKSEISFYASKCVYLSALKLAYSPDPAEISSRHAVEDCNRSIDVWVNYEFLNERDAGEVNGEAGSARHDELGVLARLYLQRFASLWIQKAKACRYHIPN